MYSIEKLADGNYNLYKNGSVCRCPKVPPIMLRHEVTGQPQPAFFNCTSSCALAEVKQSEGKTTYNIYCGTETREIDIEVEDIPNSSNKSILSIS